MYLIETFQVYKCTINGVSQSLDGRLVSDICLSDDVFLVKKKDILSYKRNSIGQEFIEIENAMNLKSIKMMSILSYGEYWEFLQAGMTARIDSMCSESIENGDILCKYSVDLK